jgi:hypothetical protein
LLEIIFILIYKLLAKNKILKLGTIPAIIIGILLFYIPYNLYVIGYDQYIENKVNSFTEQIPEYQIYFDILINDTGRNLAPIVSGIYCIGYFFIMLILAKMVDAIIKNNK